MRLNKRLLIIPALTIALLLIWLEISRIHHSAVDLGTRLQAIITIVGQDEQSIGVTVLGVDNKVYTIPITENLVIRRAVSRADDVNKTLYPEELNIEDLKTGSPVTLLTKTSFFSNAQVLPEVTDIYLGQFIYDEAFVATQLSTRSTYPAILGKIADIDLIKGVIQHEISLPYSNATTAIPVSLANVQFYKTSDPLRAQIFHAREKAMLSDLGQGDLVVVVSEQYKDSGRTRFRPVEIVIIE